MVTYPPQQPGPGWPDRPGPDEPQQPVRYDIEPYDQSYGQSAGYGPPQYDAGPGPAQPYSGPPQSAQPYSGQPYPGQPQSGQPYPTAGHAYQQGGPPGYPMGPQPTPPGGSRSPLPFILGGVGLIAVLAVIFTVVIVATRDGSDPTPGPSASASDSASASPSGSPSPTDGPDSDGVYGDKIVDVDSGLYFTKITGSDWQVGVPAGSTAKEFDHPVGQYVPLGSSNYSAVQIGQLTDDFGYTGPEDLEKVRGELVDSILKNYYFDGAKKDAKIKDEALTQYGHKAWLWAYHVTYSGSTVASGESVVIAILDTGSGKAGAFWGTVPDGHNDQISDMTDAAASLNIRA